MCRYDNKVSIFSALVKWFLLFFIDSMSLANESLACSNKALRVFSKQMFQGHKDTWFRAYRTCYFVFNNLINGTEKNIKLIVSGHPCVLHEHQINVRFIIPKLSCCFVLYSHAALVKRCKDASLIQGRVPKAGRQMLSNCINRKIWKILSLPTEINRHLKCEAFQ